MIRDRRGFTIVEVLVVSVLGTLVVLAIYQILATNQRTLRAGADRVASHRTSRSAMEVVAAELRELSTRGGDLVTISDREMEYWAMTRFGLVCGIDHGPPVVLTVRKIDAFFDASDRVVVFADNDPRSTEDDRWIPGQVAAVDTTGVTCGGAAAQELRLGGDPAAFTADSVRVGAPIRARKLTRLEGSDDGASPSLRITRDGVTTPLAGPLDEGGLRFAFFDEAGATTRDPGDVHRIEIAIDSGSPLVTSVHPRN